jgi:hypothetical protein
VTIAVAWRDGDQVFVAADSLRTFNGAGPTPLLRSGGTFIERSDASRTKSEEAGCKVFDLGGGVVATFAGSAGGALDVLISIRNSLRYGRTLRESVESAWVPGRAGTCRLLVGGGPKGDSHLYLLESDGTGREIREDRAPVVLGSLPADGKEMVRQATLLAYGIPARPPDPDLALANVLMAMQAMGRRTNMLADRAGGAFFGMRSTAGVVHPQSDILYMVFSKPGLRDHRGFEFALVGIRGEALFAWPLLTNNVAVYCTDVGSATNPDLERLIRDQLPSLDVLPPFVCLIERDVGAVVAVDRRRGAPPKYIARASTEEFGLNILAPLVPYIDRIPDPGPVPSTVVVHSMITE